MVINNLYFENKSYSFDKVYSLKKYIADYCKRIIYLISIL